MEHFKAFGWPLLVVNLCGAAIAATIWTLPALRPDFIPDVTSLVIVAATATNLIFLILAAFWSGMVTTVVKAIVDGFVAALNYFSHKIRETNWILPLCLALYFAGAVALAEIGVAPHYSQWGGFEGETLSFFARYTGMLIGFALVALLIYWLMRGWYRVTYANLEAIEQHYPKSIARAICLVPTATALGQLISAAVSFEGLAMLWQPRLGDRVYFDISLAWADILGATDGAEQNAVNWVVTGAEFWAAIFAIALSLGIWLSANFATHLVMNGQKPSVASVLVVVIVASVSIATACYFHYGAPATQADLRTGVAETDEVIETYRAEDARNLSGLESDAASLVQNYTTELHLEISEALNGEFVALTDTFENGLAVYADLDALVSQLSANEKIWRERENDEVCCGKYTGGQAGFGQVAQNLRDIADAYGKAQGSLAGFSNVRTGMIARLDVLKLEYSEALVSLDFEGARTILDRINRQSQQIYALSPTGSMGELLAVVSTPLVEGESSANAGLATKQAEALAGFETELSLAKVAVDERMQAWNKGLSEFGARAAPDRVLPGDMRLDLRKEIENLDALRVVILQIEDRRLAGLAGVEAQLATIDKGIDALLDSLALLADSAGIAQDIKTARRDLKAFEGFDRAPIEERVGALELAKENLEQRLAQPSNYPEPGEFVQKPPLKTLLTSWDIGIIYIALQVTLDLFSLGLVWIISSLHARDPKPQMA
ncbi:hypothetical protein [uncultured Tateyamaria sp.]|uniref:hypothetical protein n=1 Tax=uncultured Tateyamaria sp. TaxID=455651 RepID=UPI00261E5A81|nr:hypothetical protein [uncultured Tateyamaria sp.]